MNLPRTYRSRLVIYMAAMLIFMVAVVVFTYHASRTLILQEAERNVVSVTQQIEGQLRREAHDLAARTKMIRDNVPLTEYMFIATSLGTDIAAIRDLYQRQFGWLPAGRVVILGKTGQAMIGREHADLIQTLKAGLASKQPHDRQFYYYGKNGLELVSAARMDYRSQYLGMVAITEVIDSEWMALTRQLSDGHIVLAKDGQIVVSTLGDRQAGGAFVPGSEVVRLAGEEYLARRIRLAGADTALPSLWFVQSKAGLTRRLTEQRNLMVALAAAGCIGILLAGVLILRNFSAPLERLVSVIHEVSEGRFPEFPKTGATDEIGYLSNQFAAMVHSLRDKQEEINAIHRKLEQRAVTDELTGLYNRRYLYDLYPRLWAEATRQNRRITVILADLDLFKQINDHHGHLTGDAVLKHVAMVMRDCCRVSDFIFRLGGEEFLVLTMGEREGGETLAEKIRAALEERPLQQAGKSIRVTASFGVAEADPRDGLDGLSAVVNRADKALYAAKHTGRNRVSVAAVA